MNLFKFNLNYFSIYYLIYPFIYHAFFQEIVSSLCSRHCYGGGQLVAKSCLTLETQRAVVCQAPLSIVFPRQEYCSGLPFPSPGDLPDPGIEPRSPILQADSLPAKPQGKPKNTGVGSLSLLQKIFPIQEANQGLLHCRWILYHWAIREAQPLLYIFTSVQFSSVTQSCLSLCDLMDCRMPGFPVHHQLPELTQTHAHRVGDNIQPSHLLSAPSPPAFNLSQHQGIFKWVSSSHQVAKVLEFQLQHQSFQRIFRADFL